jgi:hypothetical protein
MIFIICHKLQMIVLNFSNFFFMIWSLNLKLWRHLILIINWQVIIWNPVRVYLLWPTWFCLLKSKLIKMWLKFIIIWGFETLSLSYNIIRFFFILINLFMEVFNLKIIIVAFNWWNKLIASYNVCIIILE